MKLLRLAVLIPVLAGLSSCPAGVKPPPPVNRCAVDLKASGLFTQSGAGASAALVTSADQLIAGPGATGRLGDVLLQNELVRVIIDKPGRTVGPFLSGGGIIDADLIRPAGQGADLFGRMGLFYAFGRLSSVHDVEILETGANGGPAVVASTGADVIHDLLNLKSLIAAVTGVPVTFVVDPARPLPLRTTTYYVLSPGERRVRMLTALCNDGPDPVQAPLIELIDLGTDELFNPGGCVNGLGVPDLSLATSCLVDSSRWVAGQARDVAYGLRSYSLDDLTRPSTSNALVAEAGIFGTFIEGQSLQGLLSWTDTSAHTRPGSLGIRGGAQRLYLRDFVIAADLAGVSSSFLESDGAPAGTVAVTTSEPAARVAILDASGVLQTVMTTDASGAGKVSLSPGPYSLSASKEGHLVGPAVPVQVTAGQQATATLQLAPGRTLSVQVTDGAGAPSPGKLTVTCTGGTCPFSKATYQQHLLLDPPPGGAAVMGFVPPSGHLSLTLPPGEYEVVVSRGPQFNTWPDTWPVGHHVDLRTADAALRPVLGRIIEGGGWQSADLHVHATNSSDSAVANELRVANFLAEGVDVMVSTDHEVITDYGPTIRALGGEHLIASLIGEEITSFTHGHFNAWPLRADASPNGGAFDHAGGEANPEYRLPELWPAVRAAHPKALLQINHPRGTMGALTLLKVDTATLSTHGDPADYNMAPAPGATADDSKLLDDGFDAIETANGVVPSFAVLNDWMTFLSRGTVRTATGVSDTHKAFSDLGGYSRTFTRTGLDGADAFTPAAFADALRAHRAFVTNGPFLKVTATRLDASQKPVGTPVEVGDTVSVGAGESLALDVDVLGPEWMQLSRLELHSHAGGREALGGASNATWPDGRILQSTTLDPANLPVEAVPGAGSLRRVHVTFRFTVTPTRDTWYVVMARGLGVRSMFPLHDGQAFAYSNAILVDADGSGKYDDFPLKPGAPLKAAPAPAPRGKARALTAAELSKVLRAILVHEHE